MACNADGTKFCIVTKVFGTPLQGFGFVAVSDTAYQAPPYHVIAYDTFQDPCNAYLEAEASRPAFLHCLSMRNVDSSHIRHVPACLITQSQYVIL